MKTGACNAKWWVSLPAQLYFTGGLTQKMHTKLLITYSWTETCPPSHMMTAQFSNCFCSNNFLKLFALLITFHIIWIHFLGKKKKKQHLHMMVQRMNTDLCLKEIIFWSEFIILMGRCCQKWRSLCSFNLWHNEKALSQKEKLFSSTLTSCNSAAG